MLYESNMSRVISELIADVHKSTDPSTISRVASQQLLGDIVRRIHNQGLDSNNKKIAGSYNTKPMYVSLKMMVRKRPGRGKNSNKSEFKNKKKRRSRYYKDGYKGFKLDQTGNSTVNLVLTGQLQNDLKMSAAGKKAFGLSFSNYGLDIYKAMEDHYKVTIWYPTKKEYDRMVKAVEDYILRNLNK